MSRGACLTSPPLFRALVPAAAMPSDASIIASMAHKPWLVFGVKNDSLKIGVSIMFRAEGLANGEAVLNVPVDAAGCQRPGGQPDLYDVLLFAASATPEEPRRAFGHQMVLLKARVPTTWSPTSSVSYRVGAAASQTRLDEHVSSPFCTQEILELARLESLQTELKARIARTANEAAGCGHGIRVCPFAERLQFQDAPFLCRVAAGGPAPVGGFGHLLGRSLELSIREEGEEKGVRCDVGCL